MKRFYDSVNQRLIYINSAATPDFWDANWEGQQLQRDDLLSHAPTTWSVMAESHLSPTTGPILEGGCGSGVQVAALRSAGFEVVGIDFAKKTVAHLNKAAPELDIRMGDVRELKFEDNHFAGYFSLGVIEHFWDGYTEIIQEAYRVIRPGGLFFLVFPYLSPIRSLKGRFRILPRWKGVEQPDDFYQFALNSKEVLSECKALGFELKDRVPMLGRQGFAEEMPRAASLVQRVGHSTSKSFWGRLYRRAVHETHSLFAKACCYSDMLILAKPD